MQISAFRHSGGQCPCGRELPIRRQQWRNKGTHELAQLSFYGKLADVALALEKGDNVYVDGRIEQRQFAPRDGSKPRTVHEIVVTPCHVIAPVRSGNKSAGAAAGKDAVNGSPIVGAEVENDWPVAG